MALTPQHTLEVIEAMEHFLEKERPPEHVRPQLDIDYRIDGQSVIIFEIRPVWNDPTRKQEMAVAKTTYVKTTGKWKVYWMRADLKWHLYDPRPELATIRAFGKLVADDDRSCFFG